MHSGSCSSRCGQERRFWVEPGVRRLAPEQDSVHTSGYTELPTTGVSRTAEDQNCSVSDISMKPGQCEHPRAGPIPPQLGKQVGMATRTVCLEALHPKVRWTGHGQLHSNKSLLGRAKPRKVFCDGDGH